MFLVTSLTPHAWSRNNLGVYIIDRRTRLVFADVSLPTAYNRDTMKPRPTRSIYVNTPPVSDVPVLAITNLSATYAEKGDVALPVLDDITLRMNEGEFVALIGPSGSGKSTLLDLISGLSEPDQGEIRIGGVALTARARQGRTAYMRQRDLLLPWRTAVANAALALEIQGWNRREARAAASRRFADLGLQGFEHLYPAQLSGGMRQRVAFVRTMLGGQRLILLDEPFGSLDALTRSSAQDWLAAALAQDTRTVLLVTHDVDEAVFLADRVVVFSGLPGRIVHEEVVNLPRPRHRAMLVSDAFAENRLTLLERLGVVSQAGL